MSTSKLHAVLRTSAVNYALFGGIAGAVTLATAVLAIIEESTFWLPAAAMTLILVGLLMRLATTSLALSDDTIHYRSLFVVNNVALADIAGARFVYGFESGKPYQRLVLSVRGQRREMVLNLGLFARAEIHRWLDALNRRL